MNRILLFFLIILPFTVSAQNKVITVDPNDIQMNGYAHETLPDSMLTRIKYTTDTFEIVDGISYAKAVDLYKRDLHPEENLVIWEEMARVYNSFCASRCKSNDERKEVYRALLLRSMFSTEESLARLQPAVLSQAETKAIVEAYSLEAKPIGVIQK